MYSNPMRTSILLLLLTACSAPPPPPPPAPLPPKPPLAQETLTALSALEATFYTHWGSIDNTEPFGRLGLEHVPPLLEAAHSGGTRSLMAFRILTRLAPDESFSEEAKAILYTSALRREKDFSRWGVISKQEYLPGVYGDELMKIGEAVVPFLRDLLSDRRLAPVIASPGVWQNRANRDRVCDYAWVMVAKIVGRKTVYRNEPRLRDPQIREMGYWLDRR